MRRSGRGDEEAAVAPARPVERRETHKMLQVLAGKVRRRKLLSPKDRNVRPMMEVVRGAAFDIIQSAGGSPASLKPDLWLDLYSGTGSVGIEAMSRGCSQLDELATETGSTSQLDELAAETAAALTASQPDYASLAARIAVSNLPPSG